jgi:hypothetical protein
LPKKLTNFTQIKKTNMNFFGKKAALLTAAALASGGQFTANETNEGITQKEVQPAIDRRVGQAQKKRIVPEFYTPYQAVFPKNNRKQTRGRKYAFRGREKVWLQSPKSYQKGRTTINMVEDRINYFK